MTPPAHADKPAPAAAHTLQDQLAPLATKLRTNRALIEPVSQVTLRLPPVAGKDRFAECVEAVLKWMSPRAGRRLPEEAWAFKSFELSEVGAQRVSAVALDQPRFWAARVDDADKAVPLRTWVTEIGIGLGEGDEVLFGARLICTARGEHPAYPRSIPGFVRQVMATGPYRVDGEAVGWTSPVVVSTDEQVDDLINLLERPTRRLPVVVLALPERSEDPQQTLVDTAALLKGIGIAAHLRILTSRASFTLTDRAGKEMSVFRQAVRIYRPGFNRWRDSALRHPLFLPERVQRWEGGLEGFTAWLIDQVLAASIGASDDREAEVPSFSTVRQLAAARDRQKLVEQGGSQEELVELLDRDNTRLRKELAEQKERLESRIETLESEKEAAEQEVDSLKREGFDLRARITLLQKRLSAGGQAPAQTPIPNSLEDFEAWAREQLAGVVTVHNRAYRGVQKSKFREPKLVYQALLLLRDYYAPMRIEGGAERKAAFDRACQDLKLEDSFVGEATRTHADLYTVSYGGRPRLLERHLKRGKAHDEALSFRLYYFWDEDTQTVVVGWLPSHLDNSMT